MRRRAAQRAARDHESHGRLGDRQVLEGRRATLEVVALQQPFGRVTGQHRGELPGQVLRVGGAGIEAACPERAEEVGGVAGEEHATDSEALHQPLMEPIQRRPRKLVAGGGSDNRTDASVECPAGALGVEIGRGRDLPVDAPGVVRLGMDQDLAPRVLGRVEEEAALVGERKVGTDVTDQEEVRMRVPREPSAEQPPHAGVASIGPDHVADTQGAGAGRRLAMERHAVAILGERHHPVAPAQVDLGQIRRGERAASPRPRSG